MNVYRITEDGSSFCIRAKTMHEAIKICETSHIEDAMEEGGVADDCIDSFVKVEREHYHTDILESCELVGPLKN